MADEKLQQQIAAAKEQHEAWLARNNIAPDAGAPAPVEGEAAPPAAPPAEPEPVGMTIVNHQAEVPAAPTPVNQPAAPARFTPPPRNPPTEARE